MDPIPGPSRGVTTSELQAYTAALNAHIVSTRQPDPNEYIPSNEWSEADKQLFFPALSRHSARRTDLIAQDSGKTQDQVERYLRALAAGSVDKPSRAGRVGKGEWTKGIAPAAREVGKKRIRDEEELADELLRSEGKRKPDDLGPEGLIELGQAKPAPPDPLAGNKHAKILRDEQTLTTLLCIANRTLSQEREVRRLKEKKKMRHRYRRSRLIEEGMTDEQITAAGGPDTIYLARAGIKPPPVALEAPIDPLQGNKHAKIIRDETRLNLLNSRSDLTAEENAEQRRLTNKKRARQRSRKDKLRKEGMTEEQIAKVDVDEVFARRAGFAWVAAEEAESDVSEDLWDYAAIHRRIGDVAIAPEVLPAMKVYLLSYLIPVMYRAIHIAEAELTDVSIVHVNMAFGLEEVKVEEDDIDEEADWEIQTTTTDLEDEELDEMLDTMDEAYDEIQEGNMKPWDDPFGVEVMRKGSSTAKSKRNEYLRLLHKYTNRRDARRRPKGGHDLNGEADGDISSDSVSDSGTSTATDENTASAASDF